MIQAPKAKIHPNYEALKSAFADGIEYRRISSRAYLEKHASDPSSDVVDFNLLNVIDDLKPGSNKSKAGFSRKDSGMKLSAESENKEDIEANKIHELINKMKSLLARTAVIEVDLQRVDEIVTKTSSIQEILQKGYSKLADTFNEGLQNPEECIKAWYDALAERAIAVARFYQGVKPPIYAIREDSNALSSSLKSNTEFREAKNAVFEQMKKLYPKTYKKIIASCEEKYDKDVQKVIDDIVRESVREGYTFVYPKKRSSKAVHKA